MTGPNVTFYERVEQALADDHLTGVIAAAARRFTTHRDNAVAAFPPMDAFRDRARQIRAHTLSRLDHYLARFAANVEAAGGHVHWAADAADANRYLTGLARQKNVRRVVKSKSMVTEEIELNHALSAAGVEVVESDLGEFIAQLAGEKPSHIIAPVLHKTRYQVGELFQQHLNVPYTDDPLELNQIARRYLRQIFLTAGMGISGVNFAVAESGSVCLVTNEGNGRLTTTAPPIHVAIMGMERLVPTFDDLNVMLNVLARSATGQKLSVYTNIIAGPRRAAEADGPEEFHVVILDNGRSRTLGTNLAEILYCIRCGACLNSCPVYQSIGGHAYGSVYPGPVGSIVTPLLMGLAPWSDLPHASSLCGACREVCPVRIDLPRLLLELRRRGAQAGRRPDWLKRGVQLYRFIAEHPALFRLSLRLGGMAGRLRAKNGWLHRLPGPLRGWTDHRAFPAPAEKSFHRWWAERQTGGNGQ